MKEIERYTKTVSEALKSASRYSPALDVQIFLLSCELSALEKVVGDMRKLETSVVKTAQGVIVHPTFRMLKELVDSATKQLKALGLTASDLQGEDENDPLIELTQRVIAEGTQTKGKTVRPLKR